MDLGFGKITADITSERLDGIDYHALIAALGVAQAASATARAASRTIEEDQQIHSTAQALIALLEGGRRWRDAARLLQGSFHPAVAERIAGKTL